MDLKKSEEIRIVISKGRWRKDKRQQNCHKKIEQDYKNISQGKVDEYSNKNCIAEYALKSLRHSQAFLVDINASSALHATLEGGSIYLKSFYDTTMASILFDKLLDELFYNEKTKSAKIPLPDTPSQLSNEDILNSNLVNWSRHSKYENPEFSLTFQHILNQISKHFDVDIFASRLNFYRDGSAWKPFHHDSHAYSKDHKMKEDFTMGVSFGDSRELSFLHEASGNQIKIPQMNGDVFAFNSDVNQRLKHGVPKVPKGSVGPRFSIIAWGKRRTLTQRNASSFEIKI